MFFGQTISGSQPVALKCDDSELIHVSTLFLRPSPQDVSKSWDVAVQGQDDSFYTVTRLTKEQPSATLDLFVTAGTAVQLVCQNGKLHKDTTLDITGYLEPLGAGDLSGEEEGSEVADDSDEGELSDENVKSAVNATIKKLVKQKESLKDPRTVIESANSTDSSEGESEDDSEEGDDSGEDDSESEGKSMEKPMEDAVDEEEEGSSDEDDDSEGEEDSSEAGSDANENEDENDSEEESEEEVPVKPVAASKNKSDKKGKVEKKAAEPQLNNKKRPAESQSADSQPAAKKAAMTPEGEYEQSVISHLKEQGGSAKIALVGAKCRKPNGMKMKLGQFLKERSGIFSISGDSVSLVKKN